VKSSNDARDSSFKVRVTEEEISTLRDQFEVFKGRVIFCKHSKYSKDALTKVNAKFGYREEEDYPRSRRYNKGVNGGGFL